MPFKATQADAARYHALLVAFLCEREIPEATAQAIARNTDEHKMLLAELHSSTFFEGSEEDIAGFIDTHLELDALESHERELARSKLAQYVVDMRAAINAGKQNANVQSFRARVLEYARAYCTGRNAQRRIAALGEALLQFGVTLESLGAAKSTHDGYLGVFPASVRAHILGLVPNVAALLGHVVSELDRLRRTVLANCTRYGIEYDEAEVLFRALFQKDATPSHLRAMADYSAREGGEAEGEGILGVFPRKMRDALKEKIPSLAALLHDVLADLEADLEAEPEPQAKRARVEAPPATVDAAALLCDEQIDGNDDPSGYESPAPTGMTPREVYLINCAPTKARPRLLAADQ